MTEEGNCLFFPTGSVFMVPDEGIDEFPFRPSAFLPAGFTAVPISSFCHEAQNSALSLLSWVNSPNSGGLNLAIRNYWGTNRNFMALYEERELRRQPGQPWTPLLDVQENREVVVALVSHTILSGSLPQSGITKSSYVTSAQLATCNDDNPLDAFVIQSYLILLMNRHPNVFVISSFRQASGTDTGSATTNSFDTNEWFATSINGFDPERHNIVVFPWHDPVSLFHWSVGILLMKEKEHTLVTFDSLSTCPDQMTQEILDMVSCLRRKFGINDKKLKIDSTQQSYPQQTGLSCGVVTLWNIMWFVAHQAPAPPVSPSALAQLRLFIVASILAGGQMCQEVLDMLPAGLFLLPPAGNNQACTFTIKCENRARISAHAGQLLSFRHLQPVLFTHMNNMNSSSSVMMINCNVSFCVSVLFVSSFVSLLIG